MSDRSPDDRAVDSGIPGYADAVEIGRGGFDVVYRARQPDCNGTVANQSPGPRPPRRTDRQRFDRERRIMGTLSDHPKHPKIAFPQVATAYDGEQAEVRAPRKITRRLYSACPTSRRESGPGVPSSVLSSRVAHPSTH